LNFIKYFRLVKFESFNNSKYVPRFALRHFTSVQAILFLATILFLSNVVFVNIYAQMPPLPPPIPSISDKNDVNNLNLRIAPNDNNPPVIDIVNVNFKQGTNLFVVNITDESDLKIYQVKYVNSGDIIVKDLLKDQNNQYISLINVQPPSSIVVISAVDAAGNKATIVKEIIIVEEPFNFFNPFIYWFQGLISNIPIE